MVVWSFPTRVVFGVGSLASLAGELGALGVRRALVVTDKGIVAAGLAARLTDVLSQAGVEHALYDGVAPNPVEQNVVDGHAAFVAHGADSVVAIGGGSAMDAAKVIALRVRHPLPLADYDDAKGGDALVTEAVPPIVAIPTTAGTGSEVGRSGVVTLEATGRKTVIFSPKLLPRLALLDPELTRGLPPRITAATGYDALTHCVEAYVSRGDHPLCDAIALGGVALVVRSFVRAVEQGDDLEARGDMMKAAMMGAVAFQKGLGACHSLAHPLSAVCGLHHGLANALCLPATVPFNLAAGAGVAERYQEIARLLGGNDAQAELARLCERTGLGAGLAAAGVKEADLDRLADEAFADGCHASNPRACTRDDMRALYQAAM